MYFNKKINYYLNYKIKIIFIFILYFSARYYGFFDKGFWGDEIITFWWTNPGQNFFDLRDRLLEGNPVIDYVPVYYYYIVSIFHNYFGYTVIITKLISLLFSFFSFYYLYKLSNLFFSKNFVLLFLIILSLCNFLIWISHDARVASFNFFFQISNIYFFSYYFIYKEKHNFFILICLFFINIITLSIHPLNLILIGSQIIFVFSNSLDLKFKEFKNYKIFFIILFSIFFTFIINYEYYIQSFSKSNAIKYNILTWSSLLSLNFRTYFSSILFGFLNLIIFLFAILKLKKIIFKKNLLKFFFIIFSLTYFFIVIVSILKAGVNSPRYYPYIVPIVLIINLYFLYSLRNSKLIFFLIFFYISSAVLNFIIKFNDPIIQSPDAKTFLKIINSKPNLPVVILDNNLLVAHYLKTGFSDKYKQKTVITVKKIDDIKQKFGDGFWLVCDSDHNLKENCELNRQGKYIRVRGFHIFNYI